MATQQTTVTHPDRWALIIPDYWPPSLNKIQRRHWSVVRKHKTAAKELLSIYCIVRTNGQPVFDGHVKLTLWRLYGKGMRKLDRDNLWGSTKPLVDALRRKKGTGKREQGGLGLIEDDDEEVCDLQVKQMKNGTLPCHDLIGSLAAEQPTNWAIDWDKDQLQTLIIIEGKRNDGN